MITKSQYDKAKKIIERYEDDLINDRYMSTRQRNSYHEARTIEDKYIEYKRKGIDKPALKD